MKAKTLILLFVALGCGMIAAVAVSKAVMDQGSAQAAEPMAEIFVAVTQLDHNAKVTAENVKLEKWPKARLPDGAVFALDQIENKYASQVIFPGEPILEKKINETRDGFATTLPEGHRVFDISCSASYIKPGDHVDILGTFHPDGRNAPPESRTVMRHVKVHGINGRTTREQEGDKAKGLTKGTFHLLVKESQLETLKLADKLGELTLHLRPFSEDHKKEDSGQEFLDWINSETIEDEDTGPKMFTDFSAPTTNDPPAEETKKHSMVIVTPNGVQTYEWSDENEMPTEVIQGAESDLQATGSSLSSSNVSSGYGGYPPTYPVGTSPIGGIPGGEAGLLGPLEGMEIPTPE